MFVDRVMLPYTIVDDQGNMRDIRSLDLDVVHNENLDAGSGNDGRTRGSELVQSGKLGSCIHFSMLKVTIGERVAKGAVEHVPKESLLSHGLPV